MRVYGASPLYNYVELVFRSKRLFIISIVLATLIVSTMAALRVGMYTATGLVLLTGKQETAYQTPDASQLGTVRNKLNLLTLLQRNPDFMKDAITHAIAEQRGDPDSETQTRIQQHVWTDNGPGPARVEYHFDTNMSPLALDSFCKEARQALNYARDDVNGILEISCRWPDRRAADILNAFYWEYHDRIVAFEAKDAILEKQLLSNLLDDYKKQEQAIEKRIVAYQQQNVGDPPVDPTGASSSYVGMLRALEDMKLSLRMAQERRDTYAQQLKTIPEKIVSTETFGSPTNNPIYLAALQKKNDAQTNLDGLKAKYQDSHPKVREAQQALDLASDQLKKAEKASKASTNVDQTTRVVNPDYVRTQAVVNQADAELQGLQATYNLKQQQAEEERRRALGAGQKNYAFKWLTDEYGIVGQIRLSLESRLKGAELQQTLDVQRSSNETTMMVKPVAEPEIAGGKSLLVYAAGPILGLIIAFAFSLVAESLDHSLRTPLEVEKHLGKPVLAVLPRMDPPRSSRRQLNSGGDRGTATLPPV